MKIQGKCDWCRACFRWKASFMRLKDAYCPQCGEKLQRTSYLKGFLWLEKNPITLEETMKRFPELFPHLQDD